MQNPRGRLRVIGALVREQRVARGYSLRQLAARCPGVSASTLQRLEAGEPVTLDHALAIFAALEVELSLTPA